MKLIHLLGVIAMPVLCLAQTPELPDHSPFNNFTLTPCGTLLATTGGSPVSVYQSTDKGLHWNLLTTSQAQPLSNGQQLMLSERQMESSAMTSAAWNQIFQYFDCKAGDFKLWKTERCFQYRHGCLNDAVLSLEAGDFLFTQTEGCYGASQKESKKRLYFSPSGIKLRDQNTYSTAKPLHPLSLTLPNGEKDLIEAAQWDNLLLASPRQQGGIWVSADAGKSWYQAQFIARESQPTPAPTPNPVEKRNSEQPSAAGKSQVMLYPQPANTSFIVKVPGETELPLKLRIIDLQGKTVLQTELSAHQQVIPCAQLGTGRYYVQGEQNGKNLFAKNLLIAR